MVMRLGGREVEEGKMCALVLGLNWIRISVLDVSRAG